MKRKIYSKWKRRMKISMRRLKSTHIGVTVTECLLQRAQMQYTVIARFPGSTPSTVWNFASTFFP
jgi:hypothetical protein